MMVESMDSSKERQMVLPSVDLLGSKLVQSMAVM